MRIGLPTSFLLHGGLLAWAMLTLEATKPFKPAEPEPVEVAIISEDGLTRLKQGDRNAKQLEAALAKAAPPSKALKEPPKPAPPPPPSAPPPPPEPVKEEPPPPPPPPPKAAEPPPPPPKVAEPPPPPPRDEIAELALKAEQEAVLEKQRQAEAEKKRQEDLARAEKAKADKAKADKARADKAKADKAKADKAKAEKALADKAKAQKDDFFEDMEKALKDKSKKQAPTPGGAQVANANLKGPTAGAPEGRDTQLTASEANLLGSMVKRRVKECWNINSGADGVNKIVVEIEVRLSPDGRITSQPRVVSRGTGPLYDDMANSAMRALVQCQPYDQLPKHLYKGGWDHMIINFDPARMF